MAATDAIVFPVKNQAYRVYFTVRDSTGAVITSWTSPTAVVTKDGGATASSTNTPTEIGTSGLGYLDLTATEMNAYSTTIKVSVTNANSRDTVVVLITEGVTQTSTSVWAYGTRTLTSFGTLVADIWSYVTRTLTSGSGLWGDTIPTWDPTVNITTYDQLFSFLRTLSYYAGRDTGNIGYLCDENDDIVAQYSFNSTDTGGFRSKPTEYP